MKSLEITMKKLFKKVLEKFGIFSKEFKESLDSATQEEREKYQKLWENCQYEKEQKTTNHTATEAFDKLIYEVDNLAKQKASVGKKFDTGKLSYTLLPWEAITEVVHVLEFGKQKYGKDNWQKVPNAKDRYLDACFRHLISYVEGETTDPESGKHHLAHAVCCLLFVLWFDLTENL